MNAKTAKLIRKTATATGISYRRAKQSWNRMTPKARAELRVQMKAEL